jgi:glutamate-1-semialdehyde 2,1-aminomutase
MKKRSIRFTKSQEFLTRALNVIPLGSQTFSKSITQYPRDCSPLFIEKGHGSIVVDIDGNRFVDVVNALAAITIGYRNPEVDRSVKNQLKKGSIFSLPGKLETVVAEKISTLVPSAEKIRFAKNGTDATSAAVRISRAYTQRDHIIVSGYHGWQDWFIGSTTRDLGVPNVVKALTHRANFNDIQSFIDIFNKFPEHIAAVIIEPLGAVLPKLEFLSELRLLCDAKGALLIFDETITGFRVSEGGAQELYGITPDLSTFGKGIANGYPLSVVSGRADVMNLMEDVFFSGTFGGDLISLAAANAVLDMHLTKSICPRLLDIGQRFNKEINYMLKDRSLDSIVSISGHPSWLFWNWNLPAEHLDIAKSAFLQNNLANGLIMLNTVNISTSLIGKARKKFFRALEISLDQMAESNKLGDFTLFLKGEVVKPLFKIR